jgi:hypothetical protein
VRAEADVVSGELDFDLRSRTVSTGQSSAEVYSVGARAAAQISTHYRASVFAQRINDVNLIQEAVLETDAAGGRLQAGMIRLPFGIYDTRETYASGLINYPLLRSGYEQNSFDWGVPGVKWIGGSPGLQVEAAGFDGVGSGVLNSRNYAGGGAVRVQTYLRNLVLGASRWDGYLSDDDTYGDRAVVQMSGVDWRYTFPQVIVRGEYAVGRLARDWMHGWYTDIYYRLPGLGKWTVVGRVEEVKPASDEAGERQITTGVRYIVAPDWDLSVNWVNNNGASVIGDGWLRRSKHAGDWYFQVYHTIGF